MAKMKNENDRSSFLFVPMALPTCHWHELLLPELRDIVYAQLLDPLSFLAMACTCKAVALELYLRRIARPKLKSHDFYAGWYYRHFGYARTKTRQAKWNEDPIEPLLREATHRGIPCVRWVLSQWHQPIKISNHIGDEYRWNYFIERAVKEGDTPMLRLLLDELKVPLTSGALPDVRKPKKTEVHPLRVPCYDRVRAIHLKRSLLFGTLAEEKLNE